MTPRVLSVLARTYALSQSRKVKNNSTQAQPQTAKNDTFRIVLAGSITSFAWQPYPTVCIMRTTNGLIPAKKNSTAIT
ncbi:MAG TPA: hypothetical protein PKO47_06005, partial [bacterium]|nr:hypothetical protein [bacterium]